MVFLDIVFTDLQQPPTPGQEIWAGGMGSSPGGIANLAMASARLDLRTALAAAFSDDGYGGWCREVLGRQEGVDLSRSRTFSEWHSPVTVSMAYAGDRAMVTHGHEAPAALADLIGTPPRTRAVITELNEDPWWLDCQAAGALVFADVGWDPTGTWDPVVFERLAGCHAFTPNEVEALAYTRTDDADAALSVIAEHVPLAVVTRGAQGAVAVDQTTGERASVPALDVKAIDPTGAGDVFAAALVAGTLGGWPLVERLRFAALASSLAVQQFGGGLAAPGWGDVADWWTRVREAAAAGAPWAEERERDYGFLTGLLAQHTGRAVRRANATIAQLSDLQHSPRGPRGARKENA
jgi:sugar/nucleoside kinase (ribokinase family)